MKIFAADHEFEYSWEEVSIAHWRKYSPWNKETGHVIAVDTLSRQLDDKTGILRTERLITCKQSAPRWVLTFLGGTDTSHVYEVSYVTPPSATSPPPHLSTDPSSPVTSTSTLPHPTASHLPLWPALHNRSPTLAPPSTPPPADALPSPPAHPAPRAPSITMLSTNLTYSDLLSVRETVTYTPSPAAPSIHSGRTRFEQNARITALCGGWARIKEKIEEFTVQRFDDNATRGRKGFEGVLEMSRRAWREREGSPRRGEDGRARL